MVYTTWFIMQVQKAHISVSIAERQHGKVTLMVFAKSLINVYQTNSLGKDHSNPMKLYWHDHIKNTVLPKKHIQGGTTIITILCN